MTQEQYYQLLCIWLTRVSKLRNAEIRTWHKFNPYTGLCVRCKIHASHARLTQRCPNA